MKKRESLAKRIRDSHRSSKDAVLRKKIRILATGKHSDVESLLMDFVDAARRGEESLPRLAADQLMLLENALTAVASEPPMDHESSSVRPTLLLFLLIMIFFFAVFVTNSTQPDFSYSCHCGSEVNNALLCELISDSPSPAGPTAVIKRWIVDVPDATVVDRFAAALKNLSCASVTRLSGRTRNFLQELRSAYRSSLPCVILLLDLGSTDAVVGGVLKGLFESSSVPSADGLSDFLVTKPTIFVAFRSSDDYRHNIPDRVMHMLKKAPAYKQWDD